MRIRSFITACAVAVIMTVGIAFINPGAVKALPPQLTQVAACAGSTFFGFPAWDACLDHENGSPVIRSLPDVWKIAFPIVETLIKVAGYIAVGFVIWGGIKYMKSQGDPSEISGAQKTIQNALIGLVIAVLSVTLVQFVASRF
jgi:hypothetical protein